jgi:hypothetical protein
MPHRVYKSLVRNFAGNMGGVSKSQCVDNIIFSILEGVVIVE